MIQVLVKVIKECSKKTHAHTHTHTPHTHTHTHTQTKRESHDTTTLISNSG